MTFGLFLAAAGGAVLASALFGPWRIEPVWALPVRVGLMAGAVGGAGTVTAAVALAGLQAPVWWLM